MDNESIIDGKYTVESKVGGGSFSDVFVVHGAGERTALKLLKKGLTGETNPEAVADFKHEFEILKDLNHPNIARILDFGYDRTLKQYYYTTELVEGKNIFDATENQPVEFILELFVQALRAFNYLHSYQVHHFDVKTANVLVASTPEPVVKVIDFGLASIDPHGRMIGTPSFMAPEIIAKERPDGRADLYSLGVLFYTCFTRQNPFRGKGVPETLRNQQTVIPPPASKSRGEIPPYLDRILAKLLEKNPANRYQRAEEVLREINFYSPKKFALETRETLLSYLPEEGRLIGRKREIQLFEESFQKVFSPTSRENLALLLIFGDRGMGKSRLLKEFKFYSQLHGVPVVSASTRESGISDWISKFRSHLTEGSATVFLLDDLDGWAESDGRFAEFRGALARMLFSDQEDRPPLLFAGASSAFETLPASLRELLPKTYLSLTVGPFPAEELKEYITSLTGLEDPPKGLLSGLLARTEGNPLLVTEVLRSLIQEGALFDQGGRWKKTTFEDLGIDFSRARFSGVLEDILFARYEKLETPLREVLEGLAVTGPIRFRDLRKFLEREDPLLLSSLVEELTLRELIIRDEPRGRYAIKNATLADLIFQKIPVERRRQLHDRASRLFDDEPERQLFHRIRGSDQKEAFDLCRKRGEEYLQQAKGKEAADLFRFALNLPIPRSAEVEIDLYLKLGEAYLISLDYKAALSTLEKVEEVLLTLKNKAENVHLQTDALLKVGAVYIKIGQLEKSRASLSAALGLLHFLKGDRVRELVAENLHGAILVQEGRWDEARQLFERTRRLWETELSPEEQKKVTNNDLGVVYLSLQEYPQALRQFTADLDFQKDLGDRLLLTRTHYHLGETYLGLKDFSKAVEQYQTAAALAQPLKNTELLLRAYNGLGNAFNLMGKPAEAVQYYERGLDLSERTGDLRSHTAILTNIGIIEASQGEFEKAHRRLDPAIAFLKSMKGRLAIDRQVLVRALLEEGDIARKEKRGDESEKILKEALQIAEEDEGGRPLRFWVLESLCELFLERRNLTELNRLLTEIKKITQTPEEVQLIATLSERIQKEAVPPPSRPLPAASLSDSQTLMRAPPVEPPKNPYASILEINKFINAESDLSFVLKTVLNYALELSQAESGLILLLNDQGDLEVKASRNITKADEMSEVSRSIARKVIQEGEWIRTDDAMKDPRFSSEASVMRLDLKSILCFPIKSRQKTIGALYLDNRLIANAFELVDLEVLRAFADQAGIAIENARLLAGYEASKRELENRVGEMSSKLEHYQSLANFSQKEIETKYDYESIVARSKPMMEIFRLLDKITETDLSVFIHGESGTGKELIARALHFNSSRAKKRFIAVNCGAIPANLIESELFGYKAGAFTGATRDKKGLFEEADGGTLFLDEVAEIDLMLQAKLLRVAQEGEFFRVGDSQPLKTDVRLLSASNKDIEKLSKEGKFREDLYYRLCQIRLDLAPLRERREDIPLLVDRFIRQEAGKPMKVSSRLLKAFMEYDWPGNIRELENLVKVAVALSEGEVIDEKAIPSNYGISKMLLPSPRPSPKINLGEGDRVGQKGEEGPAIDSQNRYDPSKSWYDYEKLIIAKAYQLNGYNAKETAKMLDLAPATLYKKIKETGLSKDDHSLYRESFHYERSKRLKDYLKPIFEAALAYAKSKPYTAISHLKVSQGYFYKVIKGT